MLGGDSGDIGNKLILAGIGGFDKNEMEGLSQLGVAGKVVSAHLVDQRKAGLKRPARNVLSFGVLNSRQAPHVKTDSGLAGSAHNLHKLEFLQIGVIGSNDKLRISSRRGREPTNHHRGVLRKKIRQIALGQRHHSGSGLLVQPAQNSIRLARPVVPITKTF